MLFYLNVYNPNELILEAKNTNNLPSVSNYELDLTNIRNAPATSVIHARMFTNSSCSAEVFCGRQPPDLAPMSLLDRGGRGLLAARRRCSCGDEMVLRDDKSDDGYHW